MIYYDEKYLKQIAEIPRRSPIPTRFKSILKHTSIIRGKIILNRDNVNWDQCLNPFIYFTYLVSFAQNIYI